MKKILLLLFLMALVSGCVSAKQHQAAVRDDGDKLTTGIVQKEIHKGMSQADVAQALGSPNIVTKDKEGKETWIYDKISTQTAYSKSSGGVDMLVIGFGGAGGGLGGAGYSSSTGASSTSQRTLTVILKFKEGLVDEYSYHSSSF